MTRYFILSYLMFQWVFIGSHLRAQDGYLLMEQYREGPNLTDAYSPWEISLVGLSSYWIPKNKNLKPKLNYLPKLRLLYRPVRSMAFTSGFEYLPLNYTYTQDKISYLDQLVYFSVPLGIRLFPYDRVHIGLAFHYNLYQKGNTLWPPKEKIQQISIAPQNLSNSLGVCANVDYNIWKKWRIEAQFRFTKKRDHLLSIQTNNFVGWFLGISHPIFQSKLNY